MSLHQWRTVYEEKTGCTDINALNFRKENRFSLNTLCKYSPENENKPERVAENYNFIPDEFKPSIGEYTNLWLVKDKFTSKTNDKIRIVADR